MNTSENKNMLLTHTLVALCCSPANDHNIIDGTNHFYIHGNNIVVIAWNSSVVACSGVVDDELSVPVTLSLVTCHLSRYDVMFYYVIYAHDARCSLPQATT